MTDGGEARKEGRVRIVYPEIQGGRVIADVDVEGLGDYFVGERTRVYVTTGRARHDHCAAEAPSIGAPASISCGSQDGAEVVVQTRRARMREGVEILSGLHDGDVVVTP